MILAPRKGAWLRLLLWMFIGFIIYGAYGERHARKRQKDRSDGTTNPIMR